MENVEGGLFWIKGEIELRYIWVIQCWVTNTNTKENFSSLEKWRNSFTQLVNWLTQFKAEVGSRVKSKKNKNINILKVYIPIIFSKRMKDILSLYCKVYKKTMKKVINQKRKYIKQ